MMKRILCIAVVICLFSSSIHAGLPVVDWSALGQRVLQVGEHMTEWASYLGKFKSYLSEFKRYKYGFMTVARGFKNIDSLKDIFVSVENLDRFIEQFYHDKNKLDSWANIMNEASRIEDEYKDLDDDRYILENPVYKNNKSLRRLADQALKDREDNLKEMNGRKNVAVSARQTEEAILEKIKKFQEMIKTYAKEGGETQDGSMTAETAKLAYTDAQIRLENLRVEVEIAGMLRSLFERYLKMDTELRNNEQVMMQEQSKEVENFDTARGKRK